MASWSKVLYIGVTSDLLKRVHEHKNGITGGFTKKYNVCRLVYYEAGEDIRGSIEREKQLKGWLRKRKVKLIEEKNPKWEDLSTQWNT